MRGGDDGDELSAAGGVRPATALFAFTRDLRLDDHLGLAATGRYGAVVPVHVIDPISTERLRRSPRRAAFYCAAIRALDAALRERGSRLIVRRGSMGPVLRGLARATGAGAVGWSIGYDARSVRAERDVQGTLEEAGLRVVAVHDAPAVPPEDVALEHRGDGTGWLAFVPYHARWRTIDPPPVVTEVEFAPLEIPSEALPEPAEFGTDVRWPHEVSERAARTALESFLAVAALHYAVARNVPGHGGTSRLSAELSFGTIGARTVARATRERTTDPFLLVEERTSLNDYLRSLARRDFFLQLAWYHESLEERPLQEKMRDFPFARSHPHLDAWRAGRTGFPLVDAGIRELRATGWMHPRVRAVAASFLCFDLGVDWRIGRDEWDRHLVEDAPALALGNWQWVAGVGADLAAYPRIYNPRKQQRRFDPAGTYVRRWIPELAGLPDDAVLDTQAALHAPQLALELFGERTYPDAVLDHEREARAFLARYARDVVSTPA